MNVAFALAAEPFMETLTFSNTQFSKVTLAVA